MPELNLKKELLDTESKAKWERVGVSRRAGALVPLFSVYSDKSLGIGDFADLKLVIDWASLSGNSIIQLLPLNELGSLFCPYDSVSSFALEPAYISIEKLPKADKSKIKTRINDISEAFPIGRQYVDYRIKHEKTNLLWEIFLEEDNYIGGKFNDFIEENAYWLEDFVLFKALKQYYKGKAWYEWEDKLKNRDVSSLELFKKQHEKEITFQMWAQWQLYQQLKEVKEYAAAKSILLKGDLPILVSRDSADVWAHPDYFKLDSASGAPPDMYCAKGQRWGMPTYNWDNIKDSDFRYLKEKLKFAQEFYDILRIDHVVGLFRIWSIPYNDPLENQGLNGSFDPKDELVWKEHGKSILSVILKSTNMLLCAEDLGVIPKACTEALKELGIPGNDVERWVKDWDVRHDFLTPSEYRALAVAMLSTHDTTNWAAWWENEAGTVDEALFIRKCSDRGIDYGFVKSKLFDTSLSRHGRLRWLNSVTSTELYISILDKRKEELKDFIDLYENTYQEKEKLWKQLGIKGRMKEESDSDIVRSALKIVLGSNAIFCINTLIDYLYLGDLFEGNAYQYRTNTPGTISEENWSLTIPISLEELLKHKVNSDIRAMIVDSQRL
jgi:4-alpha-glucanotransferase